MDILDIVMKGIIGITRSYGKKIQKQGEAEKIENVPAVTIGGKKFSAGFAREEIMPDMESGKTYYIAGHGSGHVMDGIISTVYTHAVWLDCGSEEGIIWLSVDAIGMTRIEVNKIRQMIMSSDKIKGCKFVLISCTHSHSGIDTLGYWGKPFASIPSDGKDPAYMNKLMEKCVKADENAYAAKQEGELYFGNIKIENGLKSKRDFIDRHEIMSRFRFVPSSGKNEIWMLNFGAHPNTLGGDNRKLSGEYPYFLREKIKKENGADVLFCIGPVGGMDAAEYVEDNPLECVKEQGKRFAQAALEISNDVLLTPEIKYINQPFYYPVDNYVLTLLAMKHTMSFKAYPCKDSLTGVAMCTEMTYMTIGGKKMLFLPGENFVSTVYGPYYNAQESSTGQGGEINPKPLAEICNDKDLIVYGVSNDMTGYVVPPNDFVLNKTQPFLNGTHDRFDKNHYHETNSMGYNSQKVIADTFASVVERF